MQLGRYQVSTLRPPPILSINLSQDGRFFAVAGESGYEVWRTWPLGLVRRRALPGTLARVVLLPQSPLLVLQGGGASPLYSPNKAVLFHDRLAVAVAEVEFGERIRGIAVRHSTICVALLRKTVAFEFGSRPLSGKGKARAGETGFWLRKTGEWETAENPNGLLAVATSPGSTLLALPGRQPGHVQLVNLSPCQGTAAPAKFAPQPFRSPIILAHTHALSTLSCDLTGSHLITTSERGTLLRVWDTARGRLVRELRRGVDRAEMWGVGIDGGTSSSEPGGVGRADRVIGWSDKGTIHVWSGEEESTSTEKRSSTPTPTTTAITNLLSRNLPLPKYFSSTASFAQYHLPRKNPHAFASTISAAAAASGVPSMRMSESGDVDLEQSERFVVGWIDVEVELKGDRGQETRSSGISGEMKGKRVSLGSTGVHPGVGIGMGTREERRSFGSDGTSRTATPTLRAETPTPPSRLHPHRQSSTSTTRSSALRPVSMYAPIQPGQQHEPHASGDAVRDKSQSGAQRLSGAGAAPSVGHGKQKGIVEHKDKVEHGRRTERQLVAITYGGDWYRLRIPDEQGDALEGEEGKKKGGKCDLVEYRRLGVGGHGW